MSDYRILDENSSQHPVSLRSPRLCGLFSSQYTNEKQTIRQSYSFRFKCNQYHVRYISMFVFGKLKSHQTAVKNVTTYGKKQPGQKHKGRGSLAFATFGESKVENG